MSDDTKPRPVIGLSTKEAGDALEKLGRDFSRAVGRTFGRDVHWALLVFDGEGVRWTSSSEPECREALTIVLEAPRQQ